MDPLLFQQFSRFQQMVDHHAVSQKRQVLSLPQPGHNLGRQILLVGTLPAPGIANGHRTRDLKEGLPEHVPQLLEAGGTKNGKARDLREEQRVKAAVMGLAVGAHQSGSVHPQHHMELLEGDVVDQFIIAPLQEGGVDGKHRQHPALGKACRHGHTVSFRDSYVKEPFRELPGEPGKPRAVRHGGGNGTHPPVLCSAGSKRIAEHAGKTLPAGLFQNTGLGVEGGNAVEFPGVFLREGVTLALDGVHMDHHRAAQLLGPLQHIAQPIQIVAVDGPQVREAHVLKQGASWPQGLLECGLELMVEAVKRVFHGTAPKEAAVPLFKMIVRRFAAQMGQMGGHGSHVGVDGHAVVVEDHDQRLPGGPGIVEPLVGKAAGKGTVSDESQNAVILMGQGPGPGHAQRHGHRVGSMPGDEGVMLALPGFRKTREPAELPQGGKQLLPSGKGLVDVALVAHIKDQPVGGGVKHTVDRHRQLHRSQVGGQMAAGLGDILDQKFPQFAAQDRQLRPVQGFHIRGGMNGFQNHTCKLLSAVEQVQKAPRPIDHLGAALDGKGLAQRLSADGKPGDQRCDGHGHQHRTHIQRRLEPGHDHRRSAAADDAADVAHYIVADTGHPAGTAQQHQRLLGPLFPVGRHGVKGLGIGGGDRYADDVKYDAQGDERHHDHHGHHQSRTGEHALRHQAQRPREGDGQEKHLYGPTEPGGFLLLSAAARLFSLQIKLPPKKVLLIRMDFPKSTDNRYAWGSC